MCGDQTFLDCESCEFRNRMRAQFRHKRTAVKLHCFDGKIENLRDLLVLFALGDELQDLSLPIRQLKHGPFSLHRAIL